MQAPVVNYGLPEWKTIEEMRTDLIAVWICFSLYYDIERENDERSRINVFAVGTDKHDGLCPSSPLKPD